MSLIGRIGSLLLVAGFFAGCQPGVIGEGEEFFDGSFVADGPAAQGAYPIILAHGFLSSADRGWNNQVANALMREGFQVVKTNVPAIDSVENRAAALAVQVESILRRTGAPKVHIIGHSMGGLDARYLAATAQYASRVASVTTISTPHEGSRLADVALGLQTTLDPRAAIIDSVIELLGVAPGQSPNVDAALRDLSEGNAAVFNQTVQKTPGILYQSYAGLSTIGGLPGPNDRSACAVGGSGTLVAGQSQDSLRGAFLLTAGTVRHQLEFRPHDGVVTVRSASYGEFRGCIPADHLDETTGELDTTTAFDGTRFYRDVAFGLAALR